MSHPTAPARNATPQAHPTGEQEGREGKASVRPREAVLGGVSQQAMVQHQEVFGRRQRTQKAKYKIPKHFQV